MELGLVDAIGNLQDAVRSAAKMADLEEYDTVYVEQPLTAREKMIKRLNRFLTGILANTLKGTIFPAFRIYQHFGYDLNPVLELNDPKGVYAYCLICNVD